MHRPLAPLASLAALYALAAAAPASAEDQAAAAVAAEEAEATPSLRELTTDRPDVTETPFTIDPGHLQIEATLFGYTRSRGDASGVVTESYEFATANLRVGLTDRLEIGVVWQPYRLVDPRGGSAGSEGSGDVELRAKLNLWGNDGGRTALALLPYVAFPRGEDGTRETGYGLVVPFVVELGGSFGLGINAALDLARESRGAPLEASVLTSVSLGHAWTDRLATYTEAVWESGRFGEGDVVTLGAGATYGLGENWQLDAGVNIGVSAAADRFAPFIGLTARF